MRSFCVVEVDAAVDPRRGSKHRVVGMQKHLFVFGAAYLANVAETENGCVESTSLVRPELFTGARQMSSMQGAFVCPRG